jgi:2-dehydropantoate 2-reductase
LKIVIVGCGAMGCVYAAMFAEAGHEVWGVDADADHVRAINGVGLRVEGASGDRTVQINATTDAADAGVADLLILATKAMHVADAAAAAKAAIGPETIVLSIQNGMGGPETAAEVLGEGRVAVGVVGGFGASMKGPGHAHHNGMELVRLGELAGPVTPRVEQAAALWEGAGFKVKTYDNLDTLRWEKLICNATFSATCGMTRWTIGEVMADRHASGVAEAIATEADVVARARGVTLGFDDVVAYVRDFAAAIPNSRPSLLQDVEAGRLCEIDYINGSVVRLGSEAGVPTPVNETLVALIKATEVRLGTRPAASG